MIFEIGTRVEVDEIPLWPKKCKGTVSVIPAFIRDLTEDSSFVMGDCWRLIKTDYGYKRQYYVEFDEPQYDYDGDGPYSGSEILEGFLKEIE